MNDILFFIHTIWITLAGFLLIVLLPVEKKALINSIISLLIGGITSIPAIKVILGAEINYIISVGGFLGDIPVRLDSLSAWFILIINFTCFTGTLYGMGYMKHYKDDKKSLTLHWINYLLFQVSMIWVCIVQNTLAFLILWELMSLSSLILIVFDHKDYQTIKAGLNYLVQMHISVAFLTISFVWVYLTTGSLDFLAIKSFFSNNPNIWLFLLLFIGFGIKAGFIPMHTWLPHAHPAAPSHVSGVMSGVIVKMGIYGIFRTIYYMQNDFELLGGIVLILSLLTGLYGIINSAVHRDFKKMLAYCTIENIGIIGSGIGLGMIGIGISNLWMIALGFGGALLHTLNHSLFKSLLFFSAGSIYQQTHTLDMEKLGGLIRKMPQTALLFLIGAIAIGGLPPFNGFISEFILYSGFIKGLESANSYSIFLMIASIACLSVIGGISVYTFTKSFGVIFLGSPRTHLHGNPSEVPFVMRLPQYFIILIMLSVAFLPGFYFKIISRVITTLSPLINESFINIQQGYIGSLTLIGRCFLLFLLIIGLLLLIRYFINRKKQVSVLPTWGCGYIAPSSVMQYTGKSFSKTIGKLLSFLVFEKKKYKELKSTEIFPSVRSHSAYYTDFFEFRIFDKILRNMKSFMNRFQFIQNGSLQRYILYGLFFILIIFLVSIFNLI